MTSRVKDQDLRYFLAVSRVGNFSKAADALGVTGSALSQRMRALETQIGTPLLYRDGRGARTTMAGAMIEEAIGPLFKQIDSALSDFTGDDSISGSWVSIASVQTIIGYFLGPALGTCARQHSRMRVRLLTRNSQDIVSAVETGLADFGLAYGELAISPSVTLTHLFNEELCFVFSRAYPDFDVLNEREHMELGALPLILPSRGYGLRALAERKFGSLNVRCEVDSFDEIVTLARCGLGLGLVPSALMHASNGELVELRLPDFKMIRQIVLIRRPGVAASKPLQTLLNVLISKAKEAPSERVKLP